MELMTLHGEHIRDRSFFMGRGAGAIWGGDFKKLGDQGGATPKICMFKGGVKCGQKKEQTKELMSIWEISRQP